jgi:hypothetical protein
LNRAATAADYLAKRLLKRKSVNTHTGAEAADAFIYSLAQC